MSGSEGGRRARGTARPERVSEPVRRAAALVLWAAAGIGLLFMVRRASGALPDSLLLAAGLEEASKMALFAAGAAGRRRLRPAAFDLGARGEGLLGPFFAAAAFGASENLLYYLRYPTSSIYGRLLYSYPVHLNTALLFVQVFVWAEGRPARGRLLVLGAALLGAAGYHFGLNALSVLLPRLALYLLGPLNLALFAALLWRQRTTTVRRSLRHAHG